MSRIPQLTEVGRQVATVSAQCRCRVELRGLGGFPHAAWPQVVWVGCADGAEQLAALGHGLDTALAEARLAPPDKRPFEPHLTLGRVRSNKGIKTLIHGLHLHQEVEVGPLLVTGFHLMRSQLSRGGPTYAVIQEFPLPGAEGPRA